MKRTLAISLFLALTVGAVAQTPTVVEKPAPKNASASTKPSPATVKTAANQKPIPAAAKPAVVAVKPATKPMVAGPKVNAAPTPKIVAVPAAKAHPAAMPKPSVASKPMPQPAATSVHGVIAAPARTQKTPALAVKGGPAKVAPQTKNPFNAAKVTPNPHPVSTAKPGMTVAVKDNKPVEAKKTAPRKISAEGRRDPFVSPVVTMAATGSGCSSGKRCLAIDQIALRGVVKSDNGMIAVVVNAMDKAYFLRENDPVFNGYVVKITGDSIVFKETFKDKLGKPLTRDVTKSIRRPVA